MGFVQGQGGGSRGTLEQRNVLLILSSRVHFNAWNLRLTNIAALFQFSFSDCFDARV